MKNNAIILILILLATFVGCRGDKRSKLTPHEALLGHWLAEMGDEEYYFSKDQMIMIEHGKQSKPIKYKVAFRNYPDGLIIEISPAESIKGQPDFIAHEKAMVFEKDRMTVVVETLLRTGTNRAPLGRLLWRYVDDKRSP